MLPDYLARGYVPPAKKDLPASFYTSGLPRVTCNCEPGVCLAPTIAGNRCKAKIPAEPWPISKPMLLSTDAATRKATPITTGFLDYFPLAIAAVAQLSKAGNEQHNPGKPLHWDRTKSLDHADCIVRHLIDRGSLDADGQRHSAKLAWRALALLQTELEAAAALNS